MANTRLENDRCYVQEHITRTQREADYMMYPGKYTRPGMPVAPNMIGNQCGNDQCGGFSRELVNLDSYMNRGAGKTLSKCGTGDVNPLPPGLQNPTTCKKETQRQIETDMMGAFDRYKKVGGPYPIMAEMDPSVYTTIPRGYYGDYQGPSPLGFDPTGVSFTQADTRDLARASYDPKGSSKCAAGKGVQTASAFEAGNKGVAPLFY